MNVGRLRRAFGPLLAFLLLTFLAAIFVAYLTDFSYPAEVGYEVYTSLSRGLAGGLGAALLGVAVVLHSLKARRQRIEAGLVRWLDAQGERISQEWDDALEGYLLENAGMRDVEVKGALSERDDLLRMRRYALRLFGIPIAGFLIIVSLALWAVPATEVFLNQTIPQFASFFLLAATYGTVATLVSLVATVVAVGKE